MTRARREDAARPKKAGPVVRGEGGEEPSGEAVRHDGRAGAGPADRPGAGGTETLATTVNPDAPATSHESDAGEGEDAPAEAALDAADLGAVPLEAGGDLPEPARGNEDRERDRELVGRVQSGDRRAFRELFERHHKRAYAVAYGVLKNKQDALDVVQEAFVKVHRHLDSFQGSSSFYTWLYRIVMNLAIDQLRRRKTARPVEYDDAALREGETADDSILPRMLESNPRKTVIRRELMARVEEALKTLPEYHRQVIVLREIEGLSYEEMAEVLEVPKGTIMSRLFHARRKMQVALQDFVEGGDLDVEE